MFRQRAVLDLTEKKGQDGGYTEAHEHFGCLASLRGSQIRSEMERGGREAKGRRYEYVAKRYGKDENEREPKLSPVYQDGHILLQMRGAATG